MMEQNATATENVALTESAPEAAIDGGTQPLIAETTPCSNGAGIESAACRDSARSESGARGDGPRGANSNNKPAYAQSPTALQDMFLNGLRRENIDVVLYFTDGSQERGAVRAFDTFTILLENRNTGKAQLVYKHAVIRIFPTRTPSQLPLGDRGRK